MDCTLKPYATTKAWVWLHRKRSQGNIRLYSPADIERLHQINRLTDELGINLAGVQVILDLRERLERLQLEMESSQAELKSEISRLRKRLIKGS